MSKTQMKALYASLSPIVLNLTFCVSIVKHLCLFSQDLIPSHAYSKVIFLLNFHSNFIAKFSVSHQQPSLYLLSGVKCKLAPPIGSHPQFDLLSSLPSLLFWFLIERAFLSSVCSSATAQAMSSVPGT